MDNHQKNRVLEQSDNCDLKFCVYCGNILHSAWAYCPKCGGRNTDTSFPDQSIQDYLLHSKNYNAQKHAKTRIRKIIAIWLILAIVCVFILTIATNTPTRSQTSPTPAPKINTPMPVVTPVVVETKPPDLKPQMFINGGFIKKPSYECVCPLTVSVPTGKCYYIYLDYIRPPLRSTLTRKYSSQAGESADGDVSFMVGSGKTVSIDVPVGVYKLYYACGDFWYGPKDRFGPDTIHYSSDDLLNFYTDSTNAHGHTLELWLQRDGNFDSEIIPESEFPD